jgi:hypothetical protein
MKKLYTVFILLTVISGGLKNANAQNLYGRQASLISPAKKTSPELKVKSLLQIFDSIYYWNWDTLTDEWRIDPCGRDINFVYNTSNYLTSYIHQTVNGNGWVNSLQYFYTYDAFNNITCKLRQYWNGTAWGDNYKYTYDYDAGNNLTSEIMQYWNGTTWVNTSQTTYTYDTSNNMTGELYQSWNGSAWDNYYNYTYTYDTYYNMTSMLWQYWNGTAWINISQYTYTYDGNNIPASFLGQQWNGTGWDNSWQGTYTFNAGNNLISEIGQQWSGTAWVNDYLEKYTYNVNNFEISDAYKEWNNTGTTIETGDSTYYYFQTIVGINTFPAKQSGINIYPNPTTFILTIETTPALPVGRQKSEIEILSTEGLLIKRIVANENPATIDISGFPRGMYFVKIKTDASIAAKRFIKE